MNVQAVTTWHDALLLMQTRVLPRLVVADVWLATGNCLSELAAWHVQHPEVTWLAISADDDAAITQRVRAAGAQGFVHKQVSPETFAQAIAVVIEGGCWFDSPHSPGTGEAVKREWQITPAELGLTTRQGDILALLLRGLSNKRIAQMLDISESTVKEHVTSILERLGVHTRVEVIMALQGRRLVTSADA